MAYFNPSWEPERVSTGFGQWWKWAEGQIRVTWWSQQTSQKSWVLANICPRHPQSDKTRGKIQSWGCEFLSNSCLSPVFSSPWIWLLYTRLWGSRCLDSCQIYSIEEHLLCLWKRPVGRYHRDFVFDQTLKTSFLPIFWNPTWCNEGWLWWRTSSKSLFSINSWEVLVSCKLVLLTE